MSHPLLGNLFEPDQQGRLCQLEVRSRSLLATEATPGTSSPPWQMEFPLTAESVSFSGDQGSMVVLAHPDGARLYVERSALEPYLSRVTDEALQARLSSEGQRVSQASRRATAWLALFCVALLVGGWGVWSAANWTLDRLVAKIPTSWEESLGEVVVSSLPQPVVDDPEITGPVQAILDRLLAEAGEQPYRFTLHVLESPEVNAMAAPGGEVIVYTGLLRAARTPEEVAGVLGHEIHHVLGRHSLRNMAHAVKWQALAGLFLGDVGVLQGAILAQAPDLLSLAHGRHLEEEADQQACNLLLRADIDPRGLTSFFQVLQEQQGVAAEIPEFLASHPKTGNRITAIEAFLSDHPQADGQYTPLDLDWARLQERLGPAP